MKKTHSVVLGSVTVSPDYPHTVDYERGTITFLDLKERVDVSFSAEIEPLRRDRKFRSKRRGQKWWLR